MIDEADKTGLLNFGGQLQFLMPEGTCECYWVEVNALKGEPKGLTWIQRVALAATAARAAKPFPLLLRLTKLPAVMFVTACASSATYRLTSTN